jgi:hypothetical protein
MGIRERKTVSGTIFNSELIKDRHIEFMDGEGLALNIHEASAASSDTRL